MVSFFRLKSASIFILNAILLPLILLSQDILASGTFMLLFAVCQIILLLSFARQDEATFYEWHAFFLAVAGTIFMTLILINSRNLTFEILGLILFLIYLISAIIFVIPEKKQEEKVVEYTTESGITDEDLKRFRDRDELKKMFEEVNIPDVPKQSHLYDFKEPNKNNSIFSNKNTDSSSRNNEDYYEIKAPVDTSEVYLELYPEEKKEKENISIVELKDTPKLELESLKKSVKTIDEGVTNINDKIKLIAEKAILEGAEKKLRKAIEANKVKQVYASITGEKFHTKIDCLSLKKVKKRDIVSYKSPNDAKRRGLKPCGLCK